MSTQRRAVATANPPACRTRCVPVSGSSPPTARSRAPSRTPRRAYATPREWINGPNEGSRAERRGALGEPGEEVRVDPDGDDHQHAEQGERADQAGDAGAALIRGGREHH